MKLPPYVNYTFNLNNKLFLHYSSNVPLVGSGFRQSQKLCCVYHLLFFFFLSQMPYSCFLSHTSYSLNYYSAAHWPSSGSREALINKTSLGLLPPIYFGLRAKCREIVSCHNRTRGNSIHVMYKRPKKKKLSRQINDPTNLQPVALCIRVCALQKKNQ